MLSEKIPIRVKLPIKDHPDGITIVPLADAHYGSAEFNEVRWHAAIKRIQDDPHCYAVCVGDLMDNAVKSSVSNVYKATCSPAAQKRWLVDELGVIKDRLLCGVGGNHERRSGREVDSDPLMDVFTILDIEDRYRSSIAFLTVGFTYDMKGIKDKTRTSYNIAVTHGAGGGMYIGSSANRAERYGTQIEGLDCLITGHTHRPVTFPAAKLVFDTHAKLIEERQLTVVVASSFLDYGGYAAEKMLTPTAKVLTEIKIWPDSNGGKHLRVIQ